MTIVKPPSFNEIVQTYGSPKAAVLHLLESGYTPEDISWKMNVPYYLVRLYMSRIEPAKPTLFTDIAQVYDRLAILRSKKGKETELVKFFRRRDLDLEVKTRLALGKIVDESLRIGPGVVERATSTATGTSSKEVKKLLVNYGEYGEVVFLLLEPKASKLTVEEVYESIRLLPNLEKVKERDQLVASLLEACTPQEGKYIVRLLLFDLKLGYYQRTVIHAAARAYKVPSELIENVCAIIGLTEGIMLAPKGALALEEVKLRPGQFLKPQLAHLYQSEKVTYPALVEHKLDGSRLQIHKWGTQIRLYSRQGTEKKETLPEAAEIATRFNAQSCIVDSEVIAIDAEGRSLPFQTLLERTVPKSLSAEDLKQRKKRVAITVRAFDLIYLNGREITDLPLSERRKYLVEVVPAEYLVEGLECQNEIDLMNFYENTLKQGYEGIVVKNLDSPYQVGQRTYTWLKLKPERDTIDCTFVKALYGKGKRAGLYSSFLMVVQDPREKKLYTIGKVSNLSEKAMEELKNIVENTKASQDEEGVFIKPSIVVEVTYQEIQIADNYTSGYALRVPKVVRFRPDKTVNEIDSLEKMQKLYELQYERQIPQTL
ncbi:MAG: ATP-dependent DNA ligase [Candidatus Bathyarchaeota archaeon]|nr:MAG: ATP-dependent DNA ligase [Candidatus Bathyarchaeota archaeon]